MAAPSASCPGTLARQALHVADDAMLPQYGAGERHRPSTRQRAGAGRARATTAAWVAILGAVAPPGRRWALPHAAPRTRAPLPEKKPVRRHRTQRAKARRVGPRRRRLPAPPCSAHALKHANLCNAMRNRPACMPLPPPPRDPSAFGEASAGLKREGLCPGNQTTTAPAPHVGAGQPDPPYGAGRTSTEAKK